jgi:hypothetical protein
MSLDNDAREFGQHFKQGGWRLGLLVARNVEPHKGQGKPRPQVDEAANATADEKPTKVSGTDFATKSGVSKQCVAYYYKAWQLAAEDGKCPHAETLSPDDEVLDDIEEDDEHTREMWSKYLEKARTPAKPGGAGGTTGKSGGTSSDKGTQAVEALTGTSDKLSKNLQKVVNGVGPKLMGDDAELKAFVEQLRQTRFELDRQCREIDQLLERIGFADGEADAATESN